MARASRTSTLDSASWPVIPGRGAARHPHWKRHLGKEQPRRAPVWLEGPRRTLGAGGSISLIRRAAATSTGTTIPQLMDTHSMCVRPNSSGTAMAYHSFSFAYGTGAASNFSTSMDDPTQYIRSSARLLATEQVLFQPNDKFAIMPIAVYQRTKDGNPQHPWNQWLSFGARPEVFFTKYLSLAFEGGSIIRTPGASTKAGCASSRSRRKSEQAESSRAGRCFASS